MEQKKAPLDLGLKMLENYKIVRHNEFRFISSEFGFVNSFIKMEPSLFAFGQPYRIKEGRNSQIHIHTFEYSHREG